MAKKSPFSGINLSDQFGLDQRLFDEQKPREVPRAETPEPATKPASPPKSPAATKPTETLPTELDDLSESGYTSHSYRFTDDELRWLQRFCLEAGAKVGRPVHHNTLMRVLLRLADEEWKASPNENRLLKLLSQIKSN
jgi:hypothetical protein